MPMCPTYTFIDRANGLFNRAMDFKKDYSAILSAAWEIDSAYDSYLMNPEENSYELLRSLGLVDAEMTQEAMETRAEFLKKLAKAPPDNPFRRRMLQEIEGEIYGSVEIE